MDLTNIFPLLPESSGFLVLAFYAILVLALTTIASRGFNKTKSGFLVANRQVGFWQGSMSVAAANIWAPAMFISCLQGYVNGLSGVIWMIIGNAFCLIIFGYFTPKIKEQFPDGFTLSGYFKEKYGSNVQTLLGIELITLSIASLSVNILAGSQAIQALTGINYHLVSVIIPVIALSYALRGGLRASIVTEMIKVWIFITFWLAIIAWTISVNGGIDTIIAGIGGKTGAGDVLWGTDFTNKVFIGFGLPVVLSLLSAPWADNTFYQRTFAIKKEVVRPAFITGALMGVTVTISGALLGMAAAGMKLDIPTAIQTYTNIVMFGLTLPSWLFPVLIFVIFASLISVLDSQLGTAASLLGDDIHNRFNKNGNEVSSVNWSRWGMVIVSVLAVGIVNIPGITLLTIFLVYGISRAIVWWPVMISLINGKLISATGMFWGIVSAWCIGMPIYLYGQVLAGGPMYILFGTLFAVFGSGILCILITKLTNEIK
jgi:Na+/proline symporter